MPEPFTQCKEISRLHLPLRELNIGTYVEPTAKNPYHPICWATMSTTVFAVVHMFSERGISAVPILDKDGVVIDLYETVDVIVSFACFSPYSSLTACHRLSLELDPIKDWISI